MPIEVFFWCPRLCTLPGILVKADGDRLSLIELMSGTQMVFAVLIGVVVLKERLSLARLASIRTTLIGTTVLKLGR